MDPEREKYYDTADGYYSFKGNIPYSDYMRLLDIARKNNLFTFDINNVITFVIRDYMKKVV